VVVSAFDVELQALPATRAETDRVHADLAQAVGDVTANVHALLGSGWRGPAATAYRSGFDEWRDGAEQVLRALTTMSDLLMTTEHEYEGTDAGVAVLHQRLGSRLT
jgi:WXG100 family type VII secretion target